MLSLPEYHERFVGASHVLCNTPIVKMPPDPALLYFIPLWLENLICSFRVHTALLESGGFVAIVELYLHAHRLGVVLPAADHDIAFEVG